MSINNKPKLSIAKQIEHLKQKGIKFESYSEKEAYVFLQNNSYLFKAKAYLNTFKEKDSLGKTLEYKDLDFKHLVDLSTIDMHFRRFLVRLTLDLEHILKSKIMRDFNNSPYNGYEIIADFLAQNSYADDFIKNQLNNINRRIEANKDLSAPTEFILKKYQRDLAIWNFIEITQFGIFIEFANFFYEKHKNKEFDAIKHSLFNVKFLRNACAHNNCILANLKDNIRNPQRQSLDIIFGLKIFKKKDINFIKKQMMNRSINDFVTTVLVYDKICRSSHMKYYCYSELYDLMIGRFLKNKDLYKKSKIIKRRYIFCLRILKFLKNKQELNQ
ncbi:hypothetical protein CR66_05310 [Campylobacter mucosalis]|uniref:Abi family protein n=1 Tax=Campylobacter mucosalis TaxID=202 RepID=UPI0004D576E8|nr:Abi family protein [Campylobacter mucosalis]KEA45828.1 hypothetical protein CR66_05310 [Campylobacter mucosalis]QKF62352.1 Abi-like protein [Campylobacter mucosalis]